MKLWCKLTLLVLLSASTGIMTGCSLNSRVPVVQSERIVRIPPPRPEPLSKPDLDIGILVPENTEDKLYAQIPEEPGLLWDYTYVILTWDDFLTLTQFLEEVKFTVGEYVRVIEYWEEGNEPEPIDSSD